MGPISRFMLNRLIGFCFVDIACSLPTGFTAMFLYRASGPCRGHPVFGFGLGRSRGGGASQALVPQHTLIQIFLEVPQPTLLDNFFTATAASSAPDFFADFFWRRFFPGQLDQDKQRIEN